MNKSYNNRFFTSIISISEKIKHFSVQGSGLWNLGFQSSCKCWVDMVTNLLSLCKRGIENMESWNVQSTRLSRLLNPLTLVSHKRLCLAYWGNEEKLKLGFVLHMHTLTCAFMPTHVCSHKPGNTNISQKNNENEEINHPKKPVTISFL